MLLVFWMPPAGFLILSILSGKSSSFPIALEIEDLWRHDDKCEGLLRWWNLYQKKKTN